MHPSAENQNESFRNAFKDNPHLFTRKTGIFTHMYEAAARHGNMTMPFPGPQEEQGDRPAFKV